MPLSIGWARFLFAFCLTFASLVLLNGPLRAERVHDRALLKAAFSGTVVDVDAALAQGADLAATLTDKNFEIDTLVAASVGGNETALRHIISLRQWPRDKLNAILFLAVALQQDRSVEALLQPLQPITAADPPWIYLLAKRFPKAMADGLRDYVRSVLFQESRNPNLPNPDWGALSLGRFAEATDDPALKILGLLIRAGAAVNVAAPGGGVDGNPLFAAANAGDMLLVQALRAAGATLPAGADEHLLDSSVLVGASRNGNADAVTAKLVSGINASAPSASGEYALPAATAAYQYAIARQLIAGGANPNLFGKGQVAPIHSAIAAGTVDLVETLLAAGANSKIRKGDWPLRLAARTGNRQILDALLKAGVPLIERNDYSQTILHDYFGQDDRILRTDSPWTLETGQLDVIKHLGELGFDFTAVDDSGKSVLATGVGRRNAASGAALVGALLDAGSPPMADAILQAIHEEDVASLRIIVKHKPDLSSPVYMDEAGWRASKSELAEILLRAGAALPADSDTVGRVLSGAAEAGANNVVALLLTRGSSPDGRPFEPSPISLALHNGHADTAVLLLEKGASVAAYQSAGGTILHDLVRDDSSSLSGRGGEMVFGPAQQATVARLLEGGLDLSAKDVQGKTAVELAQSHPDTLARLMKAISLVMPSQSSMHQAVRADDLAAVRKLVDDGSDPNVQDGLGRTPLTLALQFGRFAIAQFLIDAGTDFTLEPRNALQQADVDFATNPRLSASFLFRLLREQLVNVQPNKSSAASIRAFEENQAFRFADLIWDITCTKCSNHVQMKGNYRGAPGNPLESTRSDLAETTTYGVRQAEIYPLNLKFPGGSSLNLPAFGIEITFIVTGVLSVPACEFDFSSEPTCYPEISVSNPNDGSTLQVLTPQGYRPLIPTATVSAKQKDVTYRIDPGQSVILDRSLGPIEVTVNPVTSDTFSLHVEVRRSTGPTFALASGLDITDRTALYVYLAKWQKAFAGFPENAPPETIVRKKTLFTAIHVLSAMAVDKNYPSHVQELLKLRAADVVALRQSTFDLRDAILGYRELSVGQIDLLIARIDILLADAASADQTALRQIRSELVAARSSVAKTGKSLKVFSETFFSDADRIAREYQTFALELAQYVKLDEIEQSISNSTRAIVSQRLRPRDVIISDEMLEGRGKLLRQALGLPPQK
ncbi:ankyrin repeat domain-containing protein [Agrobacterium tumefaciens]|uniref:ankyrin repeat domain-containing protein n=1 Tax=Agrobacterium tumefaciens TaxID=358 RepID=UPI001571792A|nr:ankyrin repeat domain-containing protein [Agrobacterium tumefaciens]NTA19302.1 hypothetical protein [Agrobacterium tumefaciens]WCK74792.1 ankyrin repeat domain-containing protein [Agrobacterium tumefaciens]